MATPAGKGVADLLLAIAKSKPVVGSAATAAALNSDDAEAGFIGKSSKIWDEVAEALAMTMRKHGVSRDDVWKKIGVDLDNVDGLPRMEIDDSKSKLVGRDVWQEISDAIDAGDMGKAGELSAFAKKYTPAYDKSGSLAGALDHPDLYAAHPDAANIKYSTRKTMKDGFGQYEPSKDKITMSRDRMQSLRKSDLAHEVQHGIQEREGFAKGGSSGEFITRSKKKRDMMMQDIMAMNDEMRSIVKKKDAAEAIGDTSTVKSLDDAYSEVMARRSEVTKSMQGEGLMDDVSMQENAFDNYRKLAGETEARNVQKRIDMDWKQRRETPPWHTADVPESEQIVKMRGSADPRLLAGLASGIGAAAYANIDERGRPTDPEHGDIRAPDHPTVLKLADALSKISSSVEGSPAELFAPEATADWLRKLAYKQTPNWQDRIGVLGDFL